MYGHNLQIPKKRGPLNLLTLMDSTLMVFLLGVKSVHLLYIYQSTRGTSGKPPFARVGLRNLQWKHLGLALVAKDQF